MSYLDYVCKRFKDSSFENYNITGANKKAFEACKSFCDNFKDNFENGKNLLVCGKVGVGKTHLAYAIKRELHFEKSIENIVITDMMTLLNEIKNSFSNGGKFGDYSVYQTAIACNLLIIDEIGVQYGTESERVMLFELFNKRYENMKPTIAMSNLKKEELARMLGLRIIDRLCGGSEYVYINDDSNRKTTNN